MLPKEHRLPRSADIRQVVAEGFTVRTPTVTAHILFGGDCECRFCFVTGKRLGTAVKRNYAKRRFRERVRALAITGQAVNIVWRLTPQSVTASLAELDRDIVKVWAKVTNNGKLNDRGSN